MRTLNRLIQTFHQSWSEKTLASLQLSTKKGEVSIKLELQFGRPDNIKPGLAAAGHPAGASAAVSLASRKRRGRRGRKSWCSGPARQELGLVVVLVNVGVAFLLLSFFSILLIVLRRPILSWYLQVLRN